MGELIVCLIVVIVVFLIVKNNRKKRLQYRYQVLKRNHEAKKASQAKQAKADRQGGFGEQKTVDTQAKVDRQDRFGKKKIVDTQAKVDRQGRFGKQKTVDTQVKVDRQGRFGLQKIVDTQTKADRQGKLGEQMIVNTLEYLDIYGKTLSNVYVPKTGGRGTTEIDVIYINQYGIYVIESKNYNGSIYGDDKYDKWVVYYRKSRDGSENKFHFYNPVKQNETHIKHLSKELWAVDKKDLHSVVVFVEPFNMKVNSKSDVVVLRDLNSLINKYENGEETVFSKEEVDKIYNSLKPYTDVSDKVKKAHLMQAKRAKRYN